ncbi:M20 peptidase aminoacylase family protein [Bacillus atrophaeus]|uniref:M20 peptidase aminoacylase family protein n=1 Tax=Bacillus atrophaeus TaxID=1452 RepID=UPI0022811B05|nr:M20 peptidase aminoacylase family protein [Bacillus atrophaeus]MCY8907559.1 M20 peptidase aminoacylase family protein [Bacillus atrophaeus]MEC0835536.1 M20 peptidase aminoacylase family protein [Bacillus atrophaeus]MEC0846374.1 M20 peptidase aminoacylase family protein [Bacillus atrophaeus]MEC0849451.1 M20 peptidase aminoacylase family protein [Bacillus atrophaeus]MEC0864768.1 M20 peptidase aminoacylase family protein [Bacillus atrophaeus]
MAEEYNEALNKRLINMRRDLHEHPELSFKEFETTKKIRRWLEEENIEILDVPQLETGVIAEIKGHADGPVIAVRADIDALPIHEQTNLPFASKTDGTMHACGHDFHTASIIGTAILLNKRKDELKGTVRFIFQPAEEIAAGARKVIEAGVLDGVSAIFGMHNKPDLPVGTIGLKEGPLMASVDRFELVIKGKGGHAGIPNNSIDPIAAAGQIVSGLQSVVSRNISSLQNAVVSITRIQGGSSWNVIPDQAEMEGTVRTFQKEAREAVPEHMKRIAEGIAAGYGAQAEFRWFPYLPSVMNDGQFLNAASEAAARLGYQTVPAEQSPGGEDFALYQEKVPGFFVWMGTNGTEEWHHPAFTLDEEALRVAARYFAELAVTVLESIE